MNDMANTLKYKEAERTTDNKRNHFYIMIMEPKLL